MKKIEVLKSQISLGRYQDFIDEIISKAQSKRGSYVCVANVHQLMEAYFNPYFAKVCCEADIVTPDGMPLTWALKWLYNIKQDRVAGMDILPDLLKEAENKSLTVFFYGSTQAILDQTNIYIRKNYPQLPPAGFYSPPFRPLTLAEEDEISFIINSSNAHLVFVVLGCPKQEKWMHVMKPKINATLIGIGGALPVFIGFQKRAPKWMQRWGLEWAYRFGQEPGRLWKRYLTTNTSFIYYLIKEKLKLKLK